MESVTVKSGSRLHFGLIDLSGSSLRVDGGVGISIKDPSIEVSVTRNNGLDINGSNDTAIICNNTIERLTGIIKDFNFRVDIKTESASHIGLGLGTQCALSVAKAIATFFNININLNELASLVQRGGTSAIGVYSFCYGGFLVDGGRSWMDEKTSFGPSSSFSFNTLPPLIARNEFPMWGICILIPKQRKRINGEEEVKLFKEFTPIPAQGVNEACKWILMGMMPSVATQNFPSFCKSLEKFKELGFKRKEIEYAGENVHKSIKLLEKLGFHGISMSSWGPAVFGFAGSVQEADEKVALFGKEEFIDKIWVTSCNNSGAVIETL